MNSIQMIIHYLLRSRRDFLKFFGLQFCGVILALMIPIYTGHLVGSLNPPLSGDIQAILLTNFILILIFATISFLLGASARTFSAKISARALYYIRKDINEAIYRQSFSYFDKHETGQLVARATSDVDQTEQVFGFGLMLATQGFLQLAGILILAIIVQASLSWIFAIIIPISVIVSLYITLKLRPIYLESREAFGELTNTIRENIVGATVVRMFGTQEKEKGKFFVNNKRFYSASVRTVKWSSVFIPVNTILIGGMIVLTLLFGGNAYVQGLLPLSSLVTYLGYIAMMTFPLISFGALFVMYVQADAALTRIRQVIESIPEITEDPNAVSAEAIKGDVDFENVSFGYIPSNLVLRNITFHVPAGQKIAILGTTGSGKSTIINLLPRFYDVTEGQILVDGVDIRRYRLKDLRTHIGIVSQETFLFDKTIKENLTFGKEESSMEEIIEAAQTADLHSFIVSLPEGYDTLTGERGTHLSGGQKQRLSIARALLIRPKILILDDSTSSVDVETEYKIQQALEKVMYNTTTFIITQRISTIRNADQIMVLDKGRIVGLGTHQDLLVSNVLYRQIFETLLSKQKKLIAEVVKPAGKEGSDP